MHLGRRITDNHDEPVKMKMLESAGVEKHKFRFFWSDTDDIPKINQEKASNGSLTIACSAQFKIIACRIYHCNPIVMLPVV